MYQEQYSLEAFLKVYIEGIWATNCHALWTRTTGA